MAMVKEIAIVGAGPAGLIAAEHLAQAGHQVTVYDRMPSPGRKLLMAGRGGLNLTHSEALDHFLPRYGEAKDWLEPHIHAFPPDALRRWCEALGEETFTGSSGRVFPRSMKAAPLLRAWLRRLEQAGVRMQMRHRWLGWKGEKLAFLDANGQMILVRADATLLALGGASWPRLGSDGGWVPLLSDIGVPLAALRAANSGFIVSWSDYVKRFAGQPLKPVTLTHQGISRQGEVMITQQGVEGGAIYALSASLRKAIETQGHAELELDLRPGMSLDALTQKLQIPRGNKSLSTFLRKAGISPLAIALLREVTPASELAQYNEARLAARLKALPLTLSATTGLNRAISTAGGVMREAVDENFMLKAKPGTFVAGEMLDWEAPTGGYLLQACFSTGIAAANGVKKYLS